MSSQRQFASVIRVNEMQYGKGKVMHSGNNTQNQSCSFLGSKIIVTIQKKRMRGKKGTAEQVGENICSVCSDGEIKACKMRECIKKRVEYNR